MAAGLATFREVLTRENYQHVGKLNGKLLEGYQRTVTRTGLKACVTGAGANGVLLFREGPVRNYRDWLEVDTEMWQHYWFAMVNRGVLAQPYWWDEQWTVSVQHTEADIDRHLAAFAEVAPALAQAQKERGRVAAVTHS
jgi:glutamate-1-semialdehyde 2,1-aminomutase